MIYMYVCVYVFLCLEVKMCINICVYGCAHIPNIDANNLEDVY